MAAPAELPTLEPLARRSRLGRAAPRPLLSIAGADVEQAFDLIHAIAEAGVMLSRTAAAEPSDT